MKNITVDGIKYVPGKKYYVAGARSAWDTVPVGLFNTKDDASRAFPLLKPKDFIREATQQEINNFFKLIP